MLPTIMWQAAIFLLLVSSSRSSMVFTPAEVKLEDQNTCYSDNFSSSLARGAVRVINGCEFKQCIFMDGGLFWSYNQCDQLLLPNGCSIKQDKSKMFPDCCPTPSCSNPP